MKSVITFCFLLVFGTSLLAQNQNVKLFYNEYSDYPMITTGFELYDSSGNQIRNNDSIIRIKKEDIVIQEWRNGTIFEQNPLEDPDCPRTDLKTFSAILVCDISTSMSEPIEGGKTKIEVLKEVLLDFVNKFDSKRTEIAITLFAGDAIGHPSDPENKPFQPFTTDRNELKASIKSIGTLFAGTNWNAAFLHKLTNQYKKDLSALYYCQPSVRKYKPVIIFLTDGDHLVKGAVPAFDMFTVRQQAVDNNASIYCIQFSSEPIKEAQNMTDFQELANIGRVSGDNSPNYWLQKISSTELKNIYFEILTEAGSLGDPPPCYATWETHCEGNSASFTFPNHGAVSGETQFVLQPSVLPKLQVSPNPYIFRDVTPITGEQEQTLTLKATQNYVVLNDINIKSLIGGGNFEVSDWGVRKPPPITIDADSSYFIKIKYKPQDSIFTEASIDFVSSACEGNNFIMKGEMYPFVENIDFGFVGIGNNKDTTISMAFCNKTGSKIAISSIRIDGTDKANFILNNDWSPKGTLDTGQCITMTITFNSTEPPGPKTAKLVIKTDYNSNMTFEGILTADNYKNKILTVSDTIDFLDVPVFSTKDTIFPDILCNTTYQSLTVDSIRIKNDINGNFEVIEPSSVVKFNTDECLTLKARCKPTNEIYGEHIAQIIFYTNNQDTPEVYGTIKCNVVSAQSVDDEYQLSKTIYITPNPALDEITFVLKNSYGNEFLSSAEVILYNNLGSELKSFKINSLGDLDNFKINIEDMQSGVYFVGIKSQYINEFVKLSVIK